MHGHRSEPYQCITFDFCVFCLFLLYELELVEDFDGVWDGGGFLGCEDDLRYGCRKVVER
jgi:hypothetical protein